MVLKIEVKTLLMIVQAIARRMERVLFRIARDLFFFMQSELSKVSPRSGYYESGKVGYYAPRPSQRRARTRTTIVRLAIDSFQLESYWAPRQYSMRDGLVF